MIHGLREYSGKIQEIAEAVTSVLSLPVTVTDDTLVRVAGTGIYKSRIGYPVPSGSVFAKALETGKTIFIADAGNDALCQSCANSSSCQERAEICTPIYNGDTVAGIMAIFAETEAQKGELLSKSHQVMQFLCRMASLISQELYSRVLFDELEKGKKRLETLMDSISEGVVMLEETGEITAYNRNAGRIFDLDGDHSSINIREVLPCDERFLQDLFAGGSRQITVSKFRGKSGQQYVCVPNHVTRNDKIENIVLTIYPFSKVNKVLNMALLDGGLGLSAIVGNARSTLELREVAKRAAHSDSTVLITGGSGTGKELCARVIHSESRRCDAPFLAVNCAALPESLIESELFGYEDGAFSGARKGGKPGVFELANLGTLFLDEISDIPVHLQVKLLRVLEEKEVTRVGGVRAIPTDVRIIAASNADLLASIRQGLFRQDLFYRLDVLPIKVPPLKDRKEDIPLLVSHFLRQFHEPFRKNITGVDARLLDTFMTYEWPGNIRELRNVVEYGVNFTDEGLIEYETVATRLRGDRTPWIDAGGWLAAGEPAGDDNLKPSEAYEKQVIRRLLEELGSSLESKRKIASKIGCSQATLYRKIRRYRLSPRLSSTSQN